jgi:hypothetical protein
MNETMTEPAEPGLQLREAIAQLHATDSEIAALGEEESRARAELTSIGSRRTQLLRERNYILEIYAGLKAAT